MAYLDKILTEYKEKGINTPEAARREHENSNTVAKKKTPRLLPAQDFEQRDYSDVPRQMMEDLAREMEAFNRENGGQSDA